MVNLQAKNDALRRELADTRREQTATAKVLRVISRSVSDFAPVFDVIIECCQQLLAAESVAIYLVEGDSVRGVAQRGWTDGDWGRDDQPLEDSATGIAIVQRD